MLTTALIVLNIITFIFVWYLYRSKTQSAVLTTPPTTPRSTTIPTTTTTPKAAPTPSSHVSASSSHHLSRANSKTRAVGLADSVKTCDSINHDDKDTEIEDAPIPQAQPPVPPLSQLQSILPTNTLKTRKPCENCSCGLADDSQSIKKTEPANQPAATPSPPLSPQSQQDPLQSEPHPSRNDLQYQPFIAKNDPLYIDYEVVKQAARTKPRMPDDDACCGTGCVRCVFDIYDDNLMRWETRRDDSVKEQVKEYEKRHNTDEEGD